MGKASIGELQAHVMDGWLRDPESAGRAMARRDPEKARRAMEAIDTELREASAAARAAKSNRPPIKVNRPPLPRPRAAATSEADDIEVALRLFGSYRHRGGPAEP